MTAKYGLPYFQNFINSDLQPNMVRSMCCRLQLDLRELLKRGNGLFGSAEQTGHMYNLEATPAEGTTYRFAKEDRRRYPDILQAGTPEMPYYTNSSQLPVGYTEHGYLAGAHEFCPKCDEILLAEKRRAVA